MGQVTVMIAGRTYRMACGDGDEPRLEALATLYGSKIEGLRKSFGEIGDMRLHVMAALTLADELAEATKRIDELESEVRALGEQARAGDARAQASEISVAETLTKAAERIERLARSLNPAPTS
jgi:cell division protein ZapA